MVKKRLLADRTRAGLLSLLQPPRVRSHPLPAGPQHSGLRAMNLRHVVVTDGGRGTVVAIYRDALENVPLTLVFFTSPTRLAFRRHRPE